MGGFRGSKGAAKIREREEPGSGETLLQVEKDERQATAGDCKECGGGKSLMRAIRPRAMVGLCAMLWE